MGVKVRERPKGSGMWWIFIDHRGKRKSKKIGKNKSLAREAAKKIEAKLILGDVGFIDKEKNTPTFKQYVYGWDDGNYFHLGWFDKVAKLSLKNSTRIGYQQILNCYLSPTFGRKPLDEITSRSISDFVYALVEQGLRSGTVKNIKNCLSAILRHACNPDGYIESNPARGVTIPRPEDEKPVREPDTLSHG